MDGLTALSTRPDTMARDLIIVLHNLLLDLLVFWIIYILSKRVRAVVTSAVLPNCRRFAE